MSLQKFNFVPERQLNNIQNSNEYTVSLYHLSLKKGSAYSLIFSADVVRVYELEKKFIRLYADIEKKVIGWSIIEKLDNLDISDLKMLEIKLPHKSIKVPITKLVKSLNLDIKESMINLPVLTYKSALQENDIYYISLKND